MSVGVATLTAIAQGQTTNRIIRVASNFAGTWNGFMSMACQRVSGPGPLLCHPAARYRIRLSLEQTGELVSGTIDLFHEPTIGPVSGTVTEVNHLTLRGTARNSAYMEEHKIEEWDTELDQEGGNRLLGRWTADAHFLNGFGMQHWREEFVLLEVKRQEQP
jgi:hypothetical protein